MKKIYILIVLLAITAGAKAQLKINSYGMLDVKAQTQDWWPALRITVPTKSSCAYNLWNSYYNKDVFFVCGEGYLWSMKGGYFGSDIEFKTNITPITEALKKVLNLQGVRYQYKDEKEGEENNEDFRLGFIAQDVEAIFPEVVKDMPDGSKAMSYTDLIAVLVEAIKEQQTQIENLQEKVFTCCHQNPNYSPPKNSDENNGQDDIEMVNENLLQNLPTDENTIQGIVARLFHNVPNPFSANTEIRFEIPSGATSAKLLIHDMQGAEIKSYSITTKGIGNIIIQGSELQAGMYMYTLLVNNSVIDTKKMILTK
jgi:hypothetical protein